MKLTPQVIRSVQGQLSLLAATYIGAIVLALAAWYCRPILFEPNIQEKFPPLANPRTGDLRQVAVDLANGLIPSTKFTKTIEELAAKEAERRRPAGAKKAAKADIEAAREPLWAAVYGHWIDHDGFDPADRVARVFLSEESCLIFERIRRTLVAGNEHQRGRALHLLSLAATPEDRVQARALCEYSRERALRRHEPELVRQAEQILSDLGPAR
jgi:hypothetical protein